MRALRKAKKIVPVVVAVALAYADYAAGYVVGYHEIYRRHSRAAAIVLWLLLAFTQCSVYLYWIVLLVKGPGLAPKTPPLDLYGLDPSLLRVPEAFACDEHGFPFWCSHCQSIKGARVFHLNDLDACIARFDHYCLWIGTCVGRDNYLAFFKFLQFFNALFIVGLCFTAPIARDAFHRSTLLRHCIVIFVFCFFWIVMILVLFFQQLYFLKDNITTLDDLISRQARSYARWESQKNSGKTFLLGKQPRHETGKRYLNIAYNGSRVVVPYSVDVAPFSRGFKLNFINVVLQRTHDKVTPALFRRAIFIFLCPYADLFQKQAIEEHESFSFSFLEHINKQIEAGEYSRPLYVLSDLSKHSSSSQI